MSALGQLLANVIDADAAIRTLQRWAESDDDSPQTFEAAALGHFSCGHVRPTNSWVTPGCGFDCLICPPESSVLVALELIEPTVFPCIDSVVELPEQL